MRSLRILMAVVVIMSGTVIAKSQTADEIITKHIEAIGGKDAWKKINSLAVDGILSVQGNDIQISLVQLHGKGMRQDIVVQGMSGYQIITPTEGWTFLPFQGQTEVIAMSEEDVKRAQSELDIHGPLLDYKEKGHSIELAGKESIGGTECYKLAVTLKSGKKVTIFIDSKNYYAVRTNITQIVNGQDQEVETNFSEFEKIPEGIVMPKSLALLHGTMTISKIEVNRAVDENLFKPVYSKDGKQEPH
ncbi:MAG TPA: hypothetical protein VKA49_17440 [Flavitalea sp.]|nr:hypothetical protein [Flavitalea sp.]